MKQDTFKLNRRIFLKCLGWLGAVITLKPGVLSALTQSAITRPIPSTGELLPVIGMGSSRTFDVENDPEARAVRVQVLQTFFDNGGAIIDSSPMYGGSEQVIGYCLGQIKNVMLLRSHLRRPARGRSHPW